MRRLRRNGFFHHKQHSYIISLHDGTAELCNNCFENSILKHFNKYLSIFTNILLSMFWFELFVVFCCVLVVRGEHEDDGICICSACPPVQCEADVRPNCENILVGHHISCTDGETEVECEEFVCDGDDGEDAPDLCDQFCASLNCTANSTLTCDSNLDFPCFHEDTLIHYKEDQYTMEDLLNRNEPECRVPHIVESVGVVITTSCGDEPLRLTEDHLVYTASQDDDSGVLLEAMNLKTGDIVFSDLDHKLEGKQCMIVSVTREKAPQKYFGLNCLRSEVLAGGIHTSTFGTYHTIPAIYMYQIGSMFGIDAASQLGDYLSYMFSKVAV